MFPFEDGGGSLACLQLGMLIDTFLQVGMVEERRLCIMYIVGGCSVTHVPIGEWGGDENLWHVCSWGHSVTHVPSWAWGRREDIFLACSGGHSMTHVPSGGWGSRKGSQLCTQ